MKGGEEKQHLSGSSMKTNENAIENGQQANITLKIQDKNVILSESE